MSLRMCSQQPLQWKQFSVQGRRKRGGGGLRGLQPPEIFVSGAAPPKI